MKNKAKIILGFMLVSGVVIAASITKFYGDIDMQSHKITNLATPTANADGATKAYVDTQISSTAITLLPLSGGTMSGAINMGGKKITNLATPTATTDASTKGYVDDEITATQDLVDTAARYATNYVNATKATIDTSITNLWKGVYKRLKLSGGQMTGSINMGTALGDKYFINYLHSPTSEYQAVNKKYVLDNFLPFSGGTMTGNINLSGTATIKSVPTPVSNNDAASKIYVDGATNAVKNYVNTQLATKLDKSGGTMTGPINMGNSKITNLATPTAFADATTKAYVDTLVYNSPSLIDSFQFYTLESGITNVARIFDIDSTGGYIRVSMLADNAEGQYGMTATLSDTNDNVQIERADVLSKAGQGFKLWLTSNQTNDHYTSIKVRDDGNGCSVALARIKSVEAPDWDLYVCSNTSVPAENRFSYKYTQEMMYDIHKAYYNGVFAFVVGVSNTTSRTIKCGVGGEARGFYSSASYALSFVGPTTLTIPPHSCSFVSAYITGYDDNTGASIILSIANSVLMTIRDYRTYWSWSGMQP